MRRISEEASFSLWAWHLEDELPGVLLNAAATGRAGEYQGVEISPLYAAWLVGLATELGHWVKPGPGRDFVPHSPRPPWTRRHGRAAKAVPDQEPSS